jgi:hypothetical protein
MYITSSIKFPHEYHAVIITMSFIYEELVTYVFAMLFLCYVFRI